MRKNTIRVTATVATVLSALMLSHQVLAAEKVDFPLFTGESLHAQNQAESETARPEVQENPEEAKDGEQDGAVSSGESKPSVETESATTRPYAPHKPYEEVDHEAIKKEELQRLKENPIGEGDPTTRTENTHLAPYRSLVRVSAYFENYFDVNEKSKWSNGSGTVIGRDTVLTAAHCVEDDYRKLATKGHITVGFKNEKGEFDTFEIEEFIPHKIWYGRYGAFKYDVAILKIKPNSKGQHIGDVLGVVPVRQTHESRVGEKVHLSGYPSEIVNAVGMSQWGASGTITKEDAYTYTADIFTHGGQSGSALLNEKNELIGTLSTGGPDESNFIKMRPGIMEWLIENEAIPGSERNEDDEDEDADNVEDKVEDVEKDTQKDA
ncbi:trypsin-like serine peptidase [Streptococcus merionis]|uniref:Serine protease n=1 Tax=Streptococcus merionis TaxID=400065 RepID=A0A239SYY8_9STRE|nr:trypsin-like peptidase domain-containing protein [Streptococcus merionis]SNU90690.1 Cell wall surface anchor family protein [Streptococcus merionis]